MFVNGRGSIAQVHYDGEEAAAEINKLLEAVVSNAFIAMHGIPHVLTHSDRERG